MKPRVKRGLLLLAGAVILPSIGCARAKVDSNIANDGSWTRTIEFHTPDNPLGELAPTPNKKAGEDKPFEIPGPPWTVTKKKDDSDLIITAKRKVALNEVITHDITVNGTDHDKPVKVMVNETSVKQTGPHEFTYTERLHWIGPKPDLGDTLDSAKEVKNWLPKALATDEDLKKLSAKLEKEVLLILMGPPDPLMAHLLSLMMSHPDLALNILVNRLGPAVDHALVEVYGDRMTAEQRQQFTKKMVMSVFDSSQNKVSSQTKLDPSKADKKSDTGSMTALSFNVTCPGKVTSSNGMQNPITGEVFWALYPEAAAFGDITLTAKCAVGTQTASR